MYSLYDYFTEAEVEEIPDWFRHINLYFRDRITKQFVPGQPRWHQITGLNLVSTFTRSGLWDEMGTGKTVIAQARIAWLAAYGNRSICLMPPILLKQFERSFANTFRDETGEPGGLLKHIRLEIYAGDQKKRNKLIERWNGNGFPHIVLMTYEMFRKEFSLFGMYDYIVADEAKLVSNPKTDTHMAVWNFLGEKYGERGALLMNGSPANNQLIDLWGPIRLITPNAYLSTYDFYLQHVDVEDIQISYERNGETLKRSVEKIVGYRNRDFLFQNLYRQARRVETKEVQDLPELNIETVEVELSKKHLTQYQQLVREKVLFFEDGSMIDATVAAKLRQLCAQAVNNPSEVGLGLDFDSALVEMADSLLLSSNVDENKVVVFCHYRKTVERLRDRWKKYNPATIYGGADNDKQRDKFLEDASCRVALINYQSGGFGLELQHASKTIICMEPTGVPGQFWQAIKRVHREGQNDKVNVYVLIALQTIFAKLFRDMEEKTSSNNSVVSRAQLMRELLGEDTNQAVAAA